ncbi:zinc-binding dehydrogenase [Streptomyces sp. NPDC088747]|uniref:zinc-binding dehydrogenase n=1 Tax=Streptomyces sp. NPDC088747 TaxID=3365886 RepID=UPI00380E56DD
MAVIKSRALVLEKPGKDPLVREIDVLDPGPGEVRVRMAASGVCGTDGHAVEGTHPLRGLPVVLGHEGAGVVESVGAGVTALREGDHVVCALAVPCGVCRQCARGLAAHCNSPKRAQAIAGLAADGTTRMRRDGEPAHPFFGVGTLSQYTTVRQEQAVRIDSDLPLDEFCLTGCGVITGVGAALNIGQVQPGDTVVVIGCGGVGANVIQASRIAGASRIVAVDTLPEKLDLARRFGATDTVDARGDVPAAIRAIEPDGADIVFEVVGNPSLTASALTLARVGGKCVMVGIPPVGATLSLDAFALVGNRQLLGCRGGAVVPARDLERIVRFYRAGHLRLGELVGRRLALEDVGKAFAELGSSSFARSVVVF